jgi:hypothetical protein
MRSSNCTLLELKTEIEKVMDVPVSQQRLVRNGKMLKALQMTLTDIEVTDECTIHLFPIPQAVATPVSSSSATAAGQTVTNSSLVAAHAMNVQRVQAGNDVHPGALMPDHVNGPPLQIARGEMPQLNPWIQNTCKEVQMWSMILILLSVLTLTNNLQIFFSTGQYGTSPLDKAVFILDTLVSAGGVYAGRLGMVASRTLNAEDAKKYAFYLGTLSMVAILLRVLWVFDVIQQIKEAVRESQAAAAEEVAADSSGGSDTDNNTSEPPLTDDVVGTVGLQAAIISMVIICAWISCVLRSIRLRWVLRAYDRLNNQADGDDLSDIQAIVMNPISAAPVVPATAAESV